MLFFQDIFYSIHGLKCDNNYINIDEIGPNKWKIKIHFYYDKRSDVTYTLDYSTKEKSYVTNKELLNLIFTDIENETYDKIFFENIGIYIEKLFRQLVEGNYESYEVEDYLKIFFKLQRELTEFKVK